MAQEIELKFTIDSVAIAALKEHPLWQRLENRRTERTVSTYFDTPTFALRRQHIALRLRERAGTWLQTVKAPGPPGREHVRGEWECERPGPSFDLDLVTDERMRNLLREAEGAEGFVPAFTTDFERTRGNLVLKKGVVEFALDQGEVYRDELREPLCELELELVAGRSRVLFKLARRLLDTVSLRLEMRSKAERGYALGDDDPRRWSKAPPTALRADMTTADAFLAIARSCLAHLLAHERCALDGREPEGVHQMRVACRRLRSALSFLKKRLPKRARRFARELRWFASELGPARQWDVFLDETLAPLQQARPDDASLGMLAARAEEARDSGYARMREAVLSPRYARLVLDLLGWLEKKEFGKRARRTIGRVGQPVLDKRYEKVRATGTRRHELGDEELHDLRIEVKKLRYAAAFFQDLYPKRDGAEFAKVFKRLQDALGRIQDVADTPALLGTLPSPRNGAEPGSERIAQAKVVVGDHQATARVQALADLGEPLKKLADLKPYWR